jgi:hypothetical protein
MKKLALFCIVFLGLGSGSRAQQGWCTPVVDVPGSGGSGILAVDLNGVPDLHRNSLVGEGFVFTGASTTLARGMFYELSVDKHSGIVCTDNSIRVYIDFDQDYAFNGPGELVAATNYAGEGADVYSIYVPMYALEGTTRMRVVEKMVPSCGYGPIDPCGFDDVAGVHRGEIEDYTIVISGSVGLPEAIAGQPFSLQVDDGNVELIGTGAATGPVDVMIADLSGRQVLSASVGSATGRQFLGRIDRRGIYVAQLRSSVQECMIRVWVP